MAAFSRFSSAFAPSAPGNARAEPPRTRDTRQLDSAACPVDGEVWKRAKQLPHQLLRYSRSVSPLIRCLRNGR